MSEEGEDELGIDVEEEEEPPVRDDSGMTFTQHKGANMLSLLKRMLDTASI